MRTWYWSDRPDLDRLRVGDRYISKDWMLYERRYNTYRWEYDGLDPSAAPLLRWVVLANYPVDYPLDEWDLALLRYSLGLSEDVKL